MRSREKAFTPWVSVPRKPRATRRRVLCTQVASRRKAGRPSTEPRGPLRPHHHVGLAAREHGQGPVVEVGVAEVDLVGDHPAAARLEDAAAAAPGRSWARRSGGSAAAGGPGPAPRGSPTVRSREPFSERTQLVVPAAAVERRHELPAGRRDDPLLVVDGDDDAQLGGAGRHADRASCSALQPPGRLPAAEQRVLHGGVLPVARSPRHQDVALGEPARAPRRGPGRRRGRGSRRPGGWRAPRRRARRPGSESSRARAGRVARRPARPRRAAPARGRTSPRRSCGSPGGASDGHRRRRRADAVGTQAAPRAGRPSARAARPRRGRPRSRR